MKYKIIIHYTMEVKWTLDMTEEKLSEILKTYLSSEWAENVRVKIKPL